MMSFHLLQVLTFLTFLQSSLVTSLSSSSATSRSSIQFRNATPKDLNFIRKTLLTQMMNPFVAGESNFLVAYDRNSRDSNDNDDLVGFGQVRNPISTTTSAKKNRDENSYYELASLFVLPQFRTRGIGSAIVTKLLQRFDDKRESSIGENSKILCLLTLRPTIPFYEPFGFREVIEDSEIPPPLRLELQAGQLLSALLGNEIVCMVRETI